MVAGRRQMKDCQLRQPLRGKMKKRSGSEWLAMVQLGLIVAVIWGDAVFVAVKTVMERVAN
jgi:hypothetical protein